MLNQIKYYISKIIKKLHIAAIKNSTIHETSKVASASHIVNSSIKKYSYVGNYCTIVDVKIGSFCSISDNVVIGGAMHPIEWVSTSPVFHEGKNILNKNFSSHPFKLTNTTIIQNDVWIGTNCLIKGGVTIENGAVIGMGSVVTKDIGAYEIWAGNPAKMISTRFNESTIENLLDIKWWDLNDDEMAHILSFNKVPIFIKDYKNKGI